MGCLPDSLTNSKVHSSDCVIAIVNIGADGGGLDSGHDSAASIGGGTLAKHKSAQ